MLDKDWRLLLATARRTLGKGASLSWGSESWCAWTTFTSLQSELTYWHCGLPEEHELLESSIADGGTWGQPFKYSDLAHFIIPASFYWEQFDETGQFRNGHKTQALAHLSKELLSLGIPHRRTNLVLEVKLY